MRTRVKICCISSVEEAQLAIQSGADAIGLVGRMPSGPGVIDDQLINRIARATPPPIATFLLTSETKAEAVIAHHHRVQTNTIQLVDALEGKEYDLLRKALPAINLIQVIHVRNEAQIEEALQVAPLVDAILLDSGNPHSATKVLGGTGKTHNWAVSRRIVEQVPRPVFLAGGLHADNVKNALDQIQPFGIDECSSLRTNGHLDPAKIDAFFSAVHA